MVQRDGSVAFGKSPARLKREFQSAWVVAGWLEERVQVWRCYSPSHIRFTLML